MDHVKTQNPEIMGSLLLVILTTEIFHTLDYSLSLVLVKSITVH